MTFYPDNALVPQSLISEKFVLYPLTPAHVALDYAALMSSKEMLRVWSGSPWPADNFTLAENREDLAWHWDEHQKRIAFTFTVLNPTEDKCLGCVYIKSMAESVTEPVESITEPVEVSTSTGSVYSALVRFWVAKPYLAHHLDKTLLLALQRWFSAEWAFTGVFWHTPANNPQQIALFQTNGLQNLGKILLPNRGGEHLLYK